MGKSKKSKNKADKLYAKRSKPAEKKLNPFELHINKEKHAILNKQAKNNRGFPGRSRDKAFQLRQNTIGQEYINKHKQNTFIDRRYANGYEMSGRQHKKMAIYNLNDEEILTHKGQTLEQVERFDIPEQDYDSDDDKLNSEFTEAAHFGNEDPDAPKDRKSVIEELIADSKRRKAEKLKENEEVFELTQTLDAHWKNLIPLVGKLTKTDELKEKPDDYDRAMREMIFERRGEPTNPLKTKEELERLEKEKQYKLEVERKKRMLDDETRSENVPKHRSADDLDDGCLAVEINDEPDLMIAYDIEEDAMEANNSDTNEDSDDNDSNPENEDLNKELGDKQTFEKLNNNEEPDGEEDLDIEEPLDEESNSSSDDQDNLSDLKESDESDEDQEDNENNLNDNIEKKEIVQTSKAPTNILPDQNLMKHRIPGHYITFSSILDEKTPKELSIIISSMIKNNNLSVGWERKDKLLALFAFLLQYINDMFTAPTSENICEQFKKLNQIVPQLYTLNQQYPEETSKCFKEVIKEKQEVFKKKSKFYPALDTIIFFKIISVLFSTSDFRHPIVTPSTIFLGQILTRCKVISRKDISIGLFLCTVYLEYSQLSSRIFPAVLNFLNGIIYFCVQKRSIELYKIIPPFRIGSNMLVPVVSEKDVSFVSSTFKMTAADLILSDIDENFKVRALGTTLNLIQEYMKIYADSPGIHYFVHNSLVHIEKLNREVYPDIIVQKIDEIELELKPLLEIKVNYLVEKAKKPKTLRLLEPKVEKVFDGSRKHQVTSKVRAEREKIIHKLKREKKGAIREIRRDNEFLQRVKKQQQIRSDRIRNEKVKSILSDAFNQQGELKAMERKKRR